MFTDTSYMALKGQMRRVRPNEWEGGATEANKAIKIDSDPQEKTAPSRIANKKAP